MSNNSIGAARLRYFAKRTNMLRPQTQQIALHLIETGTISRVEAEAIHKCRNVAGNIKELRDLGVGIRSDFKVDTTGQRYVRYVVE